MSVSPCYAIRRSFIFCFVFHYSNCNEAVGETISEKEEEEKKRGVDGWIGGVEGSKEVRNHVIKRIEQGKKSLPSSSCCCCCCVC
jgi:hypothetical protein